jgi:hypothetical protein
MWINNDVGHLNDEEISIPAAEDCWLWSPPKCARLDAQMRAATGETTRID